MFQTGAETTWSQIITVTGALAGAVILAAAFIKAINDLYKFGWKEFKVRWVTPWKARRDQRAALAELVETMSGQMAELLKEVKTNGGGSIKDIIIKVDDKVETIGARVHHQDETSATPIFKLDEEGRLMFGNSAFRELVDAEEHELTYNKYLSLVESGDRKRLITEIEDAVKMKIPLDSTIHFKTKQPSPIAVRMQATPDVRSGGALKGFFGTARKVEDG